MTKLELRGGVARILLDDGKVNAMSVELMDSLRKDLDQAEAAGAVTVLQGRPGIFSAGFDLATFKRGREATLAMLRAGAGLVERLLAFPRPVLACCTGHAYPMGAFLMLAADVRFAAAGPWKIGMNEVAIALTVPKFAIEIARHRLTPAGFARITTAAMFSPEEARSLGYVDRVLPAESLEAAVDEEAARLAKLDLPAYAATKARVNERVLAALRAAIADELG
jgi:enoyl-CoA hydratase/carnithine racemase